MFIFKAIGGFCIQVLSLSNNRLEDIHAVTALRGLHVLRVDHNRIVRLPASLSSLRELTILDVSHNRLEAMPPALADLAARLYRWYYIYRGTYQFRFRFSGVNCLFILYRIAPKYNILLNTDRKNSMVNVM